MSLSAGARLGPYEILGPLGSGGMGEVYKARDTRLDRMVAIKVSKDQFSARFEREARTAAALSHPHICHLYDVGPNYLVMEYVDGAPIGRSGGPQRLLDWAVQIADGLAAAHGAGIVHRDLKPSNILVTRAGQVKILDFGLATLGSGDLDATRATVITDQGSTVGTACYMSPEQARGEPVDARSDLWSFGVVLYELATGVRPFDGPTTPVVFEALLNRPPVPARERNPKIPVELERIIDRLLEKDRETRYQSAADLRADLKRVERDSSSGGVLAATFLSDSRRVSGTMGATANARFSPAAGRAIGLTLLTLVLLAGGTWLVYPTKSPVTSSSEYVQLTDFTDSATAPSLSADGRMVTFIHGGDFFLSRGQIFVKLLPNGDSVRLTSDIETKYGPVFTPDGSRIAYTQVTRRGTDASWDTWTVPVLGGQPSRLLPNASGLVWIGDRQVLFSEIKGTGLHMGIVTATESRADGREIYFPAHDRAMAHFAHASPDRSSVLVVEMDRTAAWQACRLVPFDGRSSGRQVGPSGRCTSAGWSPDGKWMYFGVSVDGRSHLWRQRFPDGTPEQITFGPTEEDGIAVAPDGRSLVTSVGTRQSAIWMHDASGDRSISSEGFAVAPRLSRDGKRVFYLLYSDTASSGELHVMDTATGKSERVLPGVSVADYEISSDEMEVAYTTKAGDGESAIWLASLDRRSAPRLVARGGDQVSFGASGELFFRELEKNLNFLVGINRDGSGRHRIVETPILNKLDVSPDGEWIIAFVPLSTENRPADALPETVAIPLHGGARRKICVGLCRPSLWSLDGKVLYVGIDDSTSVSAPGRTLAIPVPAGKSIPDLPAGGVRSAAGDVALPPATRVIERGILFPGADPSTYVFRVTDLKRNLFRIPLH
jgi:serine/threonine protein kinase